MEEDHLVNKNFRILLKRVVALYIDLFISEAIATVLYEMYKPICDYEMDYIPFVLAVALVALLCKDLFDRSIGKRIMRLCILDIKTNSSPKLYQRVLRNITAPITVFEGVLVFMNNENRRLGDVLAGTVVDEIEHK